MELRKALPGATHSLRETLRWATRDSHTRLDALFVDVTDPTRSELYDAFVRMNHACHEQIEPLLDESPLAAVVARPRSRLPALRQDMASLGLEPLRLPPFPIATPSLHEAAGVAYVLEGSRLGAIYLHRHFEERAAVAAVDRSRRYLADSAHAGEFRTFMDMLSALDWYERSTEAAASAANVAFDHFALAARQAGAAR